MTKQSVKQALKSALPQCLHDENVNQFTTICYSGHGEVDQNGHYYFAIDPRDRNTWISGRIMDRTCRTRKQRSSE